MMLRTFSLFRHETSLREQRLMFENGGEAPEPIEPATQAEIPNVDNPETPEPILAAEGPDVLVQGIGAAASARVGEADNIAKQQQEALKDHKQKTDTLIQEAGTTPAELGRAPLPPENMEKMDPALSAEINKLPQALQSPVMRIISDTNTADALEAIQSLQGITKLGPQVLDTMLALPLLNENNQLKTKEELNVLKSSKPENASEQAALDFLMQLSDSGRAMMEKIMSVGKELHEKSKEAPLSPDVAQEIKVQHERWKNATTQEERDIAEGRMLLAGAVVDENGNVTTHTPPTFGDIVMGLYKLITGIFGQLGGKKTAIEKKAEELTEPKGEEVPADKLSPKDRAKEITEIEADLKTSEEIKDALEKDIKGTQNKMETTNEEAKSELQKKLDGMKKQLAELEAAMAVKTARLEELRGASETSAKDNEKTPEKETLVLFEKEIDNYVVFLLGSRDVKHSMFDINTWYDQLNTEEGKQAAKTIVERANEKLKNAGTKYSIQLENNNLRFEDGIPDNPEEEKLLDTAKTDYLVAEGKSGTNVADDIEYSNQYVTQEHGYIPYLEALLEQVQDSDEWTGDSDSEQAKETALLQSAAQAVQKNLQVLASALDAAEDKKSPAYENLRTLYCEKSARLTELIASVDEEFENSDLRNADMAAEQVTLTIDRMTPEEAISWVTKTMATIDGNNWQSSGLKETYGKLSYACQAGLEKKLGEEKVAAMNNPEAMKAHVKHCMEVAKLFTGRTDIDSDLTNIDFAISMAKEAMDFPDLALRYQETALKKPNPIRGYLELHTPIVLAKTTNLPADLRDNPEVKSMLATLGTTATSIEEQAQHYAILRSLDAILTKQPQPDVQAELDAKMGPYLDQSYAAFETFLDGTWSGAENISGINAAIGDPPLSGQQVEAWELLSDISGYGYDLGDKTWSYVGQGAKIAAMIASGVAVGIATGGLGILAAAAIGGATMTATNAVMNQQGFDDLDDAAKVYGTDLAVNTATIGAARYLAAGRAAYQLSKGGLLAQSGGLKGVLKVAGEKGGGRLLASLDDASNIGTRLVGAAGEGAADVLVGTTLDTTLRGGEFVDNLESNAMFFGLSFAEFGPGALRGLRSLPQENLHGLAQLVNTANVQKADLQTLCGPTVSVKDLLESTEPHMLLGSAGLDKKTVTDALANLNALKQTKNDFETTFKEAAARGTQAETTTESQPEKGPAKVETAEEAELAKAEANILAADIAFEQSVREKIDTANGGSVPEVKMTGEFLTKAGLTHNEITHAKNLGILVDDGGLYVLKKADGAPVTPDAAPLRSDLEASVRSKIEAAFGDDPLEGELSGEFLKKAGLTQAEINQAKDAGILVQGEHHYVLTKTDKPSASVEIGLPRKVLDGLQSRIGTINLKSLKTALKWATTTFKNLPKTLQDTVRPLFQNFTTSIQNLAQSSRENLSANMKKANDAFVKFRAAVNEFLTRSEYKNRQNSTNPGPEVALGTSTIPAGTDIPRPRLTLTQLRTRTEESLKQPGLSDSRVKHLQHVLADLAIQADRKLSPLEKAEQRLALLLKHKEVKSDTKAWQVNSIEKRLRSRIAEIKSQTGASPALTTNAPSNATQPLPAPPGFQERQIKQSLRDARSKTKKAATRLDEARVKVKAAEEKFGKDLVPEYTKNELKEAQKSFREAQASLNDLQKVANEQRGVSLAPATNAPSNMNQPLPAPPGFQERQMRQSLRDARSKAKLAATRLDEARVKVKAAEERFGKDLVPEYTKNEFKEAQKAFREAQASLNDVRKAANEQRGINLAPATNPSSRVNRPLPPPPGTGERKAG